MNKLRFILLLIISSICHCAVGQDSGDTIILRPTNVAITFDAGGVRNLDTYLSPIKYSGYHVGLSFEHLRATSFRPHKWINQVSATIGYDNIENPVGNNTMHQLLANVNWNISRRYRNVLTPNLDFFVGSHLGFDGGITYTPINSNNVCSPQIYINAGITGMVVYRFKLGKLPITARYQPTIPVIGGYYLPDYDQSFYEIYLGNYRDAMNFSWWGNRFDMENLVTADLHLGSAALRIGYRNNITTLWKNNISVQRTVHAFVLGISWESIRYNPRKGLAKNYETISSIY